MSDSICSGGIPEENVATTTTGILTSGKRSTGIRVTVVIPTTITNRHIIKMKNGYLIAKEDITGPPPDPALRSQTVWVERLAPLRSLTGRIQSQIGFQKDLWKFRLDLAPRCRRLREPLLPCSDCRPQEH